VTSLDDIRQQLALALGEQWDEDGRRTPPDTEALADVEQLLAIAEAVHDCRQILADWMLIHALDRKLGNQLGKLNALLKALAALEEPNP
jgi:hypothetical protein